MAKAISSIIATLLMLVITIALVGFSYTYISSTLTSKVSNTFYVADTFNGNVIISDDGTSAITSMTATLDGSPVTIAIIPNVPGLVGYWSMNDGSGIVAKDSVGNNDGILQNGPTWIAGNYGNALQFDGINDYVDIPDSNLWAFGTNDFSISMWVFFNAFTITNSLISQHLNDLSNWKIYSTSSGSTLTFYINSIPQVSATANLATGKWYHIAFVKSGGVGRFYINGVSIGSGAVSSVPNVAKRVTIGAGDEGGPGYWVNGIIDEVSIYNRALSQSEINQLYSGLVSPGQTATIKPLTTLASGSHQLRLCTTSMCTTAILIII